MLELRVQAGAPSPSLVRFCSTTFSIYLYSSHQDLRFEDQNPHRSPYTTSSLIARDVGEFAVIIMFFDQIGGEHMF
jgi:hypothetical protein